MVASAPETWWGVLPPLLAAALLLALPGVLLLLPLRLRPLALIAAAAPTSLALIGIAGVLGGFTGVRFLWFEPFVLAVLAGLLLEYAVRRWPGGAAPERLRWVRWRRSDRRALREGVRRHPLAARRILLVLCWSLGTVAFAVTMFHGVPSPSHLSQTYDNVFHLNATMSILAHGNASSLQLRTLTEPLQHFATYPAAWHATAAAAVQMTGADVPTAFNGLAIAVFACAWMPGVAWFSAGLVRRSDRLAATAIALVLATGLGFYPGALLIWGVLYPTYLAYAILPAGLGLAVLVVRRLLRWGNGNGLAAGPTWTLWVLIVLWLAAAGFSHPRSLIGAAVVAVPLAVAVAVDLLRRRWRTGPRARRRIVAGLAIAAAALAVIVAGMVLFVYRHYDLAHRPVSDHLTGVQARPVESFGAALWQVLALDAFTGAGTQRTGPLIGFAIAVAAAVVWTFWTRHRTRWLVVAYVIVGVLYALAAGSDTAFAKIATGMWYKDRFRLAALLPALAIPLVAVFLAQAPRRWPWKGRWTAAPVVPLVTAGLTLVIAVSSWAPLGAALGSAAQTAYRLPPADDTAFVTTPKAALMRQLPGIVPAGQRVLGNPWNGSSLSWVLGDREPVFPHLEGAWDPDRVTAATRLDQLGADPAVCDALRRLHVRYVLDGPEPPGPVTPAQQQYASIHRAAAAGLLTQVRSATGMTLYRIDRCPPAGN
jgi:hypothetical protein